VNYRPLGANGAPLSLGVGTAPSPWGGWGEGNRDVRQTESFGGS